MKSLPWLRLYTEIIDDEKLGLLAFEDRWHFVALLCLKGKGVLDTEPEIEMLARKVALKMGLTGVELEKVTKRLARMGLIDCENFQPLAWDSRQFSSDQDGTAAERQKRFRESRKRNALRNGDGNAPVTRLDTDTDTDTDKEEEKKGEKSAYAPPLPPDLLKDFIEVRKAKKVGKLTATALAGIEREGAKCGLDLIQTVTACCEFGWAGFNAGWYAKRTQPAAIAPQRQAESFAERDARAKREAWEAMTNRKWPEQDLPTNARGLVIDAEPNNIRRIA